MIEGGTLTYLPLLTVSAIDALALETNENGKWWIGM